MQVAWSLGLCVLLILAVIVYGVPGAVLEAARPPIGPLAGTFSFGAAGDYGFSTDARAVMTSMGASGLDFILALGDLSYGEATEEEWCTAFEGQVGDGKALLIAGNHDEGGSDGDINAFRRHCNFGIAGPMTRDYAKEYYFDYPGSGPLARFILTSCGLGLDNDSWECAPGDAHYNFLSNAIDEAHAAGIPWVIAAMHKNCISDGGKDCDIGEAVQDLLLSKKVDLVLQGHEHAYLRSRPLVCADDDAFSSLCLASPGAWGQVIAIVGTGGTGHESLGGTEDAEYFQTWSEDTFGFLKVDVSATALDARFVPVNGTYTDAFQLTIGSAPPDFTLSASPMGLSVVPGQPAFVTVRVDAISGFAGTVDLQVSAPAGISASCDRSTLHVQEAATCTLSGGTPGSYDITFTGTSGSTERSQIVTLSIAQPSPGPDSTPPLITIVSPSDGTMLRPGTISVSGMASDDTGVVRVDLSADGVDWIPATGTDTWSGSLTLFAGERSIQARATDAAGNNGTAIVRVFVDVTPQAPSGLLNLSFQNPVVVAGIGFAAGLAAVGLRHAWQRRARRPPSG